MKRDSLDIYDDMPEDMKHYLRYMVGILIENCVILQ